MISPAAGGIPAREGERIGKALGRHPKIEPDGLSIFNYSVLPKRMVTHPPPKASTGRLSLRAEAQVAIFFTPPQLWMRLDRSRA